jgi:hypothetical protein
MYYAICLVKCNMQTKGGNGGEGGGRVRDRNGRNPTSYDWMGGGQAGQSAAIHTQGAVRFSLHSGHISCVMVTIVSDEILFLGAV